jgi:eukaryotic-like serine/threonine-protein kinase
MQESTRPRAAAHPSTARVVGRFRCEQRLGAEGLLETWRARVKGMAGFDRIFAVKCLVPGALTSRPSAAENLLRAGRAAASVRDIRIASVADCGLAPGSAFVATEYVHGVSLLLLREAAAQEDPAKKRSRAGASMVGWPVLLSHLGAEIARALAVAHAAEPVLVHGSLTPSNVMVTGQGAVKVLDFGMRVALHALGEVRTTSRKRHYLAPELARGGQPSPAGDVFALGALLQEMATLRPPGLPAAGQAGALPTALSLALRALMDPDPARRPTAEKAASLFQEALGAYREIELRAELGALARRGLKEIAEGTSPAAHEGIEDIKPGAASADLEADDPPPPPLNEFGTEEPTRILAVAEDGKPEALAGLLKDLRHESRAGAAFTPAMGTPVGARAYALPTPPAGTPTARAERAPASPAPGAPASANAPAFAKPTSAAAPLNPTANGVAQAEKPAGATVGSNDRIVRQPRVHPPTTGRPGTPPPLPLQLSRAATPAPATPAPATPAPATPVPTMSPVAPAEGLPASPRNGLLRESHEPAPEPANLPPSADHDWAPIEELAPIDTGEVSAAFARTDPAATAPEMISPLTAETTKGIEAKGQTETTSFEDFDSDIGTTVDSEVLRAFSPPEPSLRPFELEIPPRRRRIAFVTAGVLLVSGAAAALFLLAGRHPEPEALAKPPQDKPTEAAAAEAPAPSGEGSSPSRGETSDEDGSALLIVAGAPESGGEASTSNESPIPDEINVVSNPSGAVIWMAGKMKGITPTKLKVDQGISQLRLVRPGYRTKTVNLGESAVIEEELVPALLPPWGKAVLKVECRTRGKFPVLIDGQEVGQLCPTGRLGIQPGAHEVAILIPATGVVHRQKVTLYSGARRVKFTM